MTELEQILEAQRRWAAGRGISVDGAGRTPELEDNLYQPLHPQTQAEFEKGAGNELEGDMRSLRSSAALACNVFDPWRERPLRPLATACGADPDLARLRFEATFPTGLRGTPPHLDVLLDGDGTPTAIESKFTEIYSPGRHGGFAEAYFKREELWPPGLASARSLARSGSTRWTSARWMRPSS